MRAEFTIQLPAWVRGFPDKFGPLNTEEERMRFIIELSRRNVWEGTGGPFAAAVFEEDTDRLVSIGVNVVLKSGLSIAHAEMVAISLAQQEIGSPSLTGCILYTSCQPCAMCLGAVPWSDVDGIVCAAREADVREIGFDEGDKPADWSSALRRRGIRVELDVLRDEARAVLRDYRQSGGAVY